MQRKVYGALGRPLMENNIWRTFQSSEFTSESFDKKTSENLKHSQKSTPIKHPRSVDCSHEDLRHDGHPEPWTDESSVEENPHEQNQAEVVGLRHHEVQESPKTSQVIWIVVT